MLAFGFLFRVLSAPNFFEYSARYVVGMRRRDEQRQDDELSDSDPAAGSSEYHRADTGRNATEHIGGFMASICSEWRIGTEWNKTQFICFRGTDEKRLGADRSDTR